MNKEEQLNSDKKVLASLEAEYKRAQRVIYSIRALVTDLNFEELMPDSQERCLMVDELQAYDYIRTNLMNRIRFYRARVKREESIKDWSQYKNTDSTYIGVDVSNEGSHSGCCQVCGDDIATHHCGQDATCQVGDGSAVVQDPNESQPAEVLRTKEDVEKKLGIHIHEGNIPREQCGSLKTLLGMQVVGVSNGKCEGCPQDHYGTPCVKVELVGGAYICLAPLPNSIATE